MNDASLGRDPVEELAEDYIERLRRGERPSLSEYTDRFPDLAEEIRDLFPALVKIERLRPVSGELEEEAAPGQAASGPTRERLGDFRILREIGRGGMGIVYEAEQVSLGRRVALKVLPVHSLLDPKRLQRFRREARAAARLHHTNIVPVFGVGDHDGTPYFVMQYIHGLGLDEVLRELRRLHVASAGSPAHRSGRAATQRPAPDSAETVAQALLHRRNTTEPLNRTTVPDGDGNRGDEGDIRVPAAAPADRSSVRLPGQSGTTPISDSGRAYWQSVARIGVQVANALAYAAAQGVLHRDIKPSNLLLDEAGTVWVSDFGLAKSETEEDNLTQTGDVLGTLRYMAPERLTGQGDIRSDLYSLGLTLYELLTLQPAFEDSERDRLLRQVMHDEPARPRKIDRAIPRDLETIVLKATAREPALRYQAAAALADDLTRFLDDRPILARRASVRERAWRWCRRNPVEAGLLGLLAASVLAGLVGVSWQWRRAEAKAAVAMIAERKASVEAVHARRAERDARSHAARADFGQARALVEQGDVIGGSLWMTAALKEAPDENQEFRTMVRANLAAWREQIPALAWHVEAGAYAIAPAPDGETILAACGPAGAKILDAHTGQLIRVVGGDEITPDRGPAESRTRAVAYCPDGSKFATSRGASVQLRDSKTGQALLPPFWVGKRDEPAWEVCRLAFSPDGKSLAVLAEVRDKAWILSVVDAATGRPLGPAFEGIERGAGRQIGFRDGGRLVLSTICDGVGDTIPGVLSRDVITMRPVGSRFAPGRDAVTFVVSPDCSTLLTAASAHIQLWDAATVAPRGSSLPFEINSAAFRPDGRILALACKDRFVRIWDIAAGRLAAPPLAQGNGIGDLRFLPDGRSLLVLAPLGDYSIWLWKLGDSLATPVERRSNPALANRILNAAFSPDATRFVTVGVEWVRLWDAATGQPIGAPIRLPFKAPPNQAGHSAYFSPDGSRLLTVCNGPYGRCTARIWDARTGAPLGPLFFAPNSVLAAAAAFSQDGKLVAMGDYASGVQLWDPASGRPVGQRLPMADCVLCVAFGPGGNVVAGGTAWDAYRRKSPYGKSELRLWNVATGTMIGEPILVGDWAAKLAVSPDGRILMSTLRNGVVELWSTETGAPVSKPNRLPKSEYFDAVFRSDSRAILIGGGEGPGEGTARLWDVQTGEPISAPMSHSAPLVKLAFRHDGAAFLAGYLDGTVRLWDVATAQPVGPPLQLDSEVSALCFAPDGRTILAVSKSGDFLRQTLPAPEDGAPELIGLKLAAATGRELSTSEGITSLVGAAWTDRRGQAAGSGIRFEAGGPDVAWHEREARKAERSGDASGASWHLDCLSAARPADGTIRIRRAWIDAAAGRRDIARATIDQALAVGPRDRCLDLLVHCALEAVTAGRNDAALWGVDLALECRPSDWRLHSYRAQVLENLGRNDEVDAEMELAARSDADLEFLLLLANRRFRQGRWAESAAPYGRARRDSMIANDDWSNNAVACLLARDVTGYRAVCADRIGRIGSGRILLYECLLVGQLCTLGPGAIDASGNLLGQLKAFADRLPRDLDGGTRHDILSVLASELHRIGGYRDASARLAEAIAAINGRATPRDQVFLAMINLRLGKRDEALRWLAKLPPPQDYRSPTFDPEIEILRHEAKAMISEENAFPADNPFAPGPKNEEE
jgi:serine/threonine protein kinase/WD40 repeat protein/tetratricopeptide (TPR) repeat protein